jgi:hypothetical protein
MPFPNQASRHVLLGCAVAVLLVVLTFDTARPARTHAEARVNACVAQCDPRVSEATFRCIDRCATP